MKSGCIVYNSLQFVPILSQINPVHALPTDFFHINLVLFSHLCLRFPSGLFHSGFPTKFPHVPLLPSIPATSPPIPVVLDWLPQKHFVRSTNYEVPKQNIFLFAVNISYVLGARGKKGR